MTTNEQPPGSGGDLPPVDPAPETPPGFMAGVRNNFLTGLIVAGPVAITIYLTWWFVTWVDGFVRPFIPVDYRPETYLPWHIPGSGLVIAFVALTLLGFLTRNLIGRTLVEFGERLLGRMPVVRAIYRGLKQVFETLFSGNGSSFRKVGLVEFPSPGMWSIVLISQPPGDVVAKSLPGQQEYISVFLPCAPNPTTGFFFYVPKASVIEIDMRTEDAATLIMSAGVVQPGVPVDKKVVALAEMANAVRLAARSESGGKTAAPGQ
ncbi:DUF502 domain-containing protein [Bradyrhizobium sp. WD16]|uniref:DUF502 domain-containing protein n=1 Tax=Bradyrhizobium sp. WD16 TaxID=1521768 RepID=UPI0020A6096D|nr:DUF502 domain-containing protein [Bradyrhizobium sp. WD16]UTD29113.1 hypothetical protein DB459_21620 [Bradyrhizobium sp. WD16]